MSSKTYYIPAIFVFSVIVAIGGYYLFFVKGVLSPASPAIIDFESCAAAGNLVMESYPEQCRTKDGRHFVRNIGNELEKSDMIRLESPRPGAQITSPLVVRGQARGVWFFEGDFPIVLTDWDGRIIAEGFATAKGEWMTEAFVPFEGVLRFKKPAYGERGSLLLRKDNPSGLPERDDALEIPILFGPERTAAEVFFCTPEQRKAEACIALYQPVCGKVNVQCITTPCPPVDETFSNSCVACMNPLVESYTEGECRGAL